MSVSIQLIKELREKTDAPMGDCKKALEECGGNIINAQDWLRKKGIMKAGSKSDRQTLEGLVFTLVDGQQGFVGLVKCETDFVAKSDKFIKLTEELSLIIKNHNADENKVKEASKDMVSAYVGTLGENIQFGKCASLKVNSGVVGYYVHNNFSPLSGKMVALVGIESDYSNKKELEDLGRKIAMHVVASNPLGLNAESIPQDIIAREKDIAHEQAVSSGKPAALVEKMVEGRIKKFVSENALLDQPLVMNPKITVSDFVAEFSKNTNSKTSVSGFILYKLS